MIGAKLLTNVKHAMTSQYNFTAKLVTERKEAGIVGDLKEPKTFKELAERYPEELKVTISDEKFLIYTGCLLPLGRQVGQILPGRVPAAQQIGQN